MRYLILQGGGVEYARALSRELFRLSRPEHARRPDDVTLYLSDWQVHPTTGAVALALPDGEIPVHAGASDTALPDMVAAVVPADERAQMGLDIAASRGKRARPTTFVPQSISTNLKTHDEMKAGGWFSDDTEL